MSLVTSRELFFDPAVPVTVDSVTERRLIQKNLHRHEYLELLFVRRGSLINRFVSSKVEMKTGDLIVLKPYVRHVLEFHEENKPVLAYCCSFLPDIVDSGIRSLDDAAGAHSSNRHFFEPFLALAGDDVSAVQLRIPPGDRKVLSARLEHLKDLGRSSAASTCAQTRCEFLSLLAFLADCCQKTGEQGQEIQAGSAIPTSRFRPNLQKTLNYIHDHAGEALVLHDMATMCGTSPTYFCQLFKHETGMTFLQYLNDLRIQNACGLLRDTGESITEICYRVGFNDYSHFSRQFKKYKGMSAADYRRGRM